jgi:hypothetical protein
MEHTVTDIIKWEYRVERIGSFFGGVKPQDLEALLNAWGEEGWEVVTTHLIENENKINVIAKRPLTDTARRRRSIPSLYNNTEPK